MSLAERRWLRLFTLTVLFFAQGIPWGFMAIELPAYLAEHGLDVARLGSIAAMTTLPFAFKFVWGPAIDAFTIARFGRRRPWIVFAQAMMAVTVGALLFAGDPGSSFDLLLAIIFTHTVFNAMQNVAVDALAIDLLDKAERGRANGLMYGAKYVGGSVGAVGMAKAIDYWGFHAAIVLQVIVLGAITLVPLLVRERDAAAPVHERRALRTVLRELGHVMKIRSAALAAVVMLLINLASGMMTAVAPALFMQDLRWSDTRYSEVAGGPGLWIGFAGSVAAGFLADKLGRRRLIAMACALIAGGWLTFALNPGQWNNSTFVYGLFFVEPLAQSIMIVGMWSLCMDTTLPRTAATQFALYTSLTNLSSTIGAKFLAPAARGALDYPAIYILAAAIQLSLLALLPFIDPRQVRHE